MSAESGSAAPTAAYKRIAAVALGVCTVAALVLWAFTPLAMTSHPTFVKYAWASALAAGTAAGTTVLRDRIAGRLDTRLGVAVVTWVPEVFQLAVYFYWLPGAITVANYMIVPFAPGYLADAWLAWPEVALGLPHPVVYAAVRDAGLLPAASWVYPLVEQQITALFLVCLVVRRDLGEMWRYTAALAVAGVSSLGFLWLLPADGAWAYFQGDPAYGTPPPAPPPWLAELHALRAGAIGDLGAAQGLLCFPSFHTVFALLLARAWGAVLPRWAAAPLVALNAAIVLSTVPVGWHYLTDVVGGIGWTVVCALTVDRLAAQLAARLER